MSRTLLWFINIVLRALFLVVTGNAITCTNIGQDPNKPPKGIVFLDGISLRIKEWTPTQIKAELLGSKTEARALGFILPSSVELVVQDHSGRRAPPAPGVQLTA